MFGPESSVVRLPGVLQCVVSLPPVGAAVRTFELVLLWAPGQLLDTQGEVLLHARGGAAGALGTA